MATKDPKQQARSMAVLCLVVGPLLVVIAVLIHYMVGLMEELQSMPEMEPMDLPRFLEMMLGYGKTSTWVVVALGIAFSITGIPGLRGGRTGRLALIAAGWIGVVGTIALGVVWEIEAFAFGVGTIWHVIGIGAHAVQTGAIVKGVLYLSTPETIAALE